MTALAGGGTGNPIVKFSKTGRVGEKISGTVLAFADTPEYVFGTRTPKLFPDGSVIMQVRVTLRQQDGSKADFYITGKGMKTAVREAIFGAGSGDLEEMAFFSIACTGGAGQSGDPYEYTAEYVPFDPSA